MVVVPLHDIAALSDDSQSKLHRNCINVTLTDDTEYRFVWVERRQVKASDARHVEAPAALDDDIVNEADTRMLKPIELIEESWRDAQVRSVLCTPSSFFCKISSYE